MVEKATLDDAAPMTLFASLTLVDPLTAL